jgi:hypothetical protein
MDAQRLSLLLDTIIDDMLAQRKQRLASRRQMMRVVLSGEDLSTLPATLECLAALHRCGYLPVIASSHSARESSLHSSCLEALAQRGIDAVADNQEPPQTDDGCSGIYFPALSTNSLSKIALGIRDNLVCRWAFHALSQNKTAIVTLNAECRSDENSPLAPALRARLENHVRTLAEYGFTVIGRHRRGTQPPIAGGVHKQLITLSDVRRYRQGQTLHIGNNTLITPAARDEIRDRGLVIVQNQQEDTCIWQR